MANTYYTPIKAKIDSLLKKRNSDVFLTYITGDRNPQQLLSTQISVDVVPLFYDLLRTIGHKNKISLFLYSNGGELEAPWALANLLREHCKKLEIIIPFKSFSAATLLCLSADKIVMTPLSLLGPIDPSGNFKIQNENKSIQVEDVAGFIDFAKEKVGLIEQGSLTEVLKSLCGEVPPSVLGSVNRTHSLVRQIASKMLTLTNNEFSETEKKNIITSLTKDLFSHKHYISRKEAKEIGLKSVDEANQEEEVLINDIFDYYKKELKLDVTFNPNDEILANEQEKQITLPRAIIASSVGSYTFNTEVKIIKQPLPDGKINIAVNMNDKGWEKIV